MPDKFSHDQDLTSLTPNLQYKILDDDTVYLIIYEGIISDIIRKIVDEEVHAYHLEKAFMLVNKRERDLWVALGTSSVEYAPKVVQNGDFSYNFDAIVRRGSRAVFVKVFADPLENLKKAELEKLREAVSVANAYHESKLYVFTKRRFGDYAVKEAANDGTLSLIEVERLKF